MQSIVDKCPDSLTRGKKWWHNRNRGNTLIISKAMASTQENIVQIACVQSGCFVLALMFHSSLQAEDQDLTESLRAIRAVGGQVFKESKSGFYQITIPGGVLLPLNGVEVVSTTRSVNGLASEPPRDRPWTT